MLEKLVPLTIPPGLFRDGTPYQAKNRWYSGQLVRFFENTKRAVGGWLRLQDASGTNLAALSGVVRAALAWRGADGTSLYGFGTITKLMLISGGSLFDITPSGLATGSANAGGSTPGTYGSGSYGAGPYGSGAAGSVPTDPDTWTLDVFGSHMVGVLTSDQKLYEWSGTPGTAATTPPWGPVFTGSLVTSGSTAAGSPTIALTATTLTGTITAGQSFVVAGVTYVAQLNATAVSNVLTVTIQPAPASTISTGTAVSGTANQAPLCRAVIVTPEHFCVALGAFDTSINALNSKLVAWASQETTSVWNALEINSAGNFPLTTLGRIMSGARTKTETLIFTDADVWRMTFIGGELDYAFSQAGDQCGLVAPNAKAVVDSGVFWMGRKNFYFYDGFVHPLPCDVADYVFTNLNDLQRAKIWAMPIPQFGEVWWFYPSGSSVEIDSYVAYSYREGHWSFGQLARTAGAPDGPIQYPVMVDTAGVIWQHENGINHQGISPAPFLESGPLEASYPVAQYGSAGDNVVRIQRLVPDENTLGSVTMQVAASFFPTDPYTYGPTLSVAAPTDVRMTGRLIRLKFTQAADADWRIGTVRAGIILGGKR